MTQLVWRVTIGTYLIQQTLSLEVNHWLCMRGMSCLSIKKTSKSESKHCHLSKFLYYVKKIVWGRLIEKTQYYRKINLSRSFTFYQYLLTCLPVLNKRFPGGPSNVKGHPNQALCWNQSLRILRGWGWEGRVLQDRIFWERSRQTDRGRRLTSRILEGALAIRTTTTTRQPTPANPCKGPVLPSGPLRCTLGILCHVFSISYCCEY